MTRTPRAHTRQTHSCTRQRRTYSCRPNLTGCSRRARPTRQPYNPTRTEPRHSTTHSHTRLQAAPSRAIHALHTRSHLTHTHTRSTRHADTPTACHTPRPHESNNIAHATMNHTHTQYSPATTRTLPHARCGLTRARSHPLHTCSALDPYTRATVWPYVYTRPPTPPVARQPDPPCSCLCALYNHIYTRSTHTRCDSIRAPPTPRTPSLRPYIRDAVRLGSRAYVTVAPRRDAIPSVTLQPTAPPTCVCARAMYCPASARLVWTSPKSLVQSGLRPFWSQIVPPHSSHTNAVGAAPLPGRGVPRPPVRGRGSPTNRIDPAGAVPPPGARRPPPPIQGRGSGPTPTDPIFPPTLSPLLTGRGSMEPEGGGHLLEHTQSSRPRLVQ